MPSTAPSADIPGDRRQSSSTAATLPAPVETKQEERREESPEKTIKDFGFLPIPLGVRYDPEHPAHFGLWMNVIFGVASTFSTSYVLLPYRV